MAFGEFARGLPVATALGPPAAPRASRAVRHDDVGDVTHEPTVVVQSPHEVDVLAVAQRLVEAVTEAGAAHEQTGTGHEGDGSTRDDQRTAVAQIQGTELFFNRSRNDGPALPRTRGATAPSSGSSKWACSRARTSSALSSGTSTSMNHNSGRVVARTPALRALAGPSLFASRTTSAPNRSRAARHRGGVLRPVVDDGDVETLERREQRRQCVHVIAEGDDDVDVVDVASWRKRGWSSPCCTSVRANRSSPMPTTSPWTQRSATAREPPGRRSSRHGEPPLRRSRSRNFAPSSKITLVPVGIGTSTGTGASGRSWLTGGVSHDLVRASGGRRARMEESEEERCRLTR